MTKRKLQINIPALIETNEFTPTVIMQKFAIAFVADREGLSPNRILKELGHSGQLWSQWIKKTYFLPWLQRVANEYLGSTALTDVYKSLYRDAVTTANPTNIKTYLERFDKDYKPTTQQNTNVTHGMTPPTEAEIEAALALSRGLTKRIQSVEAEAKDDEKKQDAP